MAVSNTVVVTQVGVEQVPVALVEKAEKALERLEDLIESDRHITPAEILDTLRKIDAILLAAIRESR